MKYQYIASPIFIKEINKSQESARFCLATKNAHNMAYTDTALKGKSLRLMFYCQQCLAQIIL